MVLPAHVGRAGLSVGWSQVALSEAQGRGVCGEGTVGPQQDMPLSPWEPCRPNLDRAVLVWVPTKVFLGPPRHLAP